MASTEDCYFFFNSTCTKGDDCAFRHEQSALGNNIVCENWKRGTCTRNPCHLRHSILETSMLNAPCYYENTPTGCLNISCQFNHRKPRPFLPGFQPPGLPTPAVVHPRLTNLFSQRLPLPNQQFRHGGPTNQRIDYMAGKSQGPPRQMGHHMLGIPPRFPNHPGEPVCLPGFQNMRPRLFQGPLPGENRPRFEPKLENNGNNTALRVPFLRNENRPMSVHRGLGPDMNNPPRHDGQDIPGPPHPSLAYGGMLPFNIPPDQIPRRSKKKSSSQISKESRSRSSSKRTVKKFDDKRRRKSGKTDKVRDERRGSLDSVDARRRKKEKVSSSKESKDSSSRLRKLKRNSASRESKIRQPEGFSSDTLYTTQVEEGDSEESNKETGEEANFPFKVKTLEEILRDKALKKFRERQKEKIAMEEQTDRSSPSLDKNDTNSETTEEKTLNNDKVYLPKKDTTTVESVGEDTQDEITSVDKVPVGKSAGASSNQQTKIQSDLTAVKVKTLDEIKRAKLARMDIAKSVVQSKNDMKSSKRILKPLKPLKSKRRKSGAIGSGSDTVGSSGSPVGNSDIDSKNGNHSTTPGLGGTGDTTGHTGTDGKKVIGGTGYTDALDSNHGTSGTGSSNGSETSHKYPKRLLPPLRRLTKSPKIVTPVSEKIAENLALKKTSPKCLKRKLEQQTYRKLVKTSKVRRQMSSSGHGHLKSPVQEITHINSNTSTSEDIAKNRCNVMPVLGTPRSGDGTRTGVNTSVETSKTTALHNKDVADQKIRAITTIKERKELTNITQTACGENSPETKARKGNSGNPEQPRKLATVVLPKQVKKIKLKRIGVTSSQDPTESKGKSNVILSVLGRKLKVKRKSRPELEAKDDGQQEKTDETDSSVCKLKKSKNDVNNVTVTERRVNQKQEVQTVERSKLLSDKPIQNVAPMAVNYPTNPQLSTINTGSDSMSQNISTIAEDIKNRSSATINESNYFKNINLSQVVPSVRQSSGNNEGIVSGSLRNKKKITKLQVAAKDGEASSTSRKTSQGTNEKKSRKVISLVDSAAAKSVEITKDQPLGRLETLKTEVSFQRKSSLDQLVKEVSDDISYDEDTLLDEELERAIADLSPVPTDDEDEILNADDLLLEIEEMINS